MCAQQTNTAGQQLSPAAFEAALSQARWLYERDEQRANQFTARITAIMGLMLATAGLAPVIREIVLDATSPMCVKWIVTGLFVITEIVVVAGQVRGAVAIRGIMGSLPPRSRLTRVWKELSDSQPNEVRAAELYRDFLGDLMVVKSDTSVNVLRSQRAIAKQRADGLKWCMWLFVIAVICLVLLATVGALAQAIGG